MNKTRTFKDYLKIYFSGVLMGSSDIVPGVSGGTMAFILGIYEELINSIKAVDKEFFIKLYKFQIKDLYNTFPWRFLLALGFGIVSAVLTLSHSIDWVLTNKPIPTWSFFLGLILASVLLVSKRITKWGTKGGISLGLGVISAYIIVGLTPATTPDTYLFTFLSGALAICAMILPGISGSFILVILGKYQDILSAVNNLDFVTLGVFMAGIAVGITTFARLLGYLFKNYHNVTIAILTGFMLGSVRKIWPYKEILQTTVDRHGEIVPLVEKNILPIINSTFYFGVLMMLVGILLVIVIEKISEKKEAKS